MNFFRSYWYIMDAIASNLFQIFQHSCTAFQHFYYDENLEKRCVRVTLNLRHFDMLVRPILSIVAGQKAGGWLAG